MNNMEQLNNTLKLIFRYIHFIGKAHKISLSNLLINIQSGHTKLKLKAVDSMYGFTSEQILQKKRIPNRSQI